MRGRGRARSPRHLCAAQEDIESSNGGADSIRKAAFCFFILVVSLIQWCGVSMMDMNALKRDWER